MCMDMSEVVIRCVIGTISQALLMASYHVSPQNRTWPSIIYVYMFSQRVCFHSRANLNIPIVAFQSCRLSRLSRIRYIYCQPRICLLLWRRRFAKFSPGVNEVTCRHSSWPPLQPPSSRNSRLDPTLCWFLPRGFVLERQSRAGVRHRLINPLIAPVCLWLFRRG